MSSVKHDSSGNMIDIEGDSEDDIKFSQYFDHQTTSFEQIIQLADHNYSKSGDWDLDDTFVRPLKTLFIHTKKSSVFHTPPHETYDDVEIDVVESSPTEQKVNKLYDEAKERGVVMEILNFACEAKKHNDPEDWEELVIKDAWNQTQHKIFEKLVDILDSDRLARLSHENKPNEPVMVKNIRDKSAKRVRYLFSEFFWDIRLLQWLHGLLIESLNSAYLAIYLEILQALRPKSPNLVDKMILNAPNVPKTITNDQVYTLLMRTWDPFAETLAQNKLKKLPHNPIIIVVPSSPSFKEIKSKRLHNWITMFDSVANVSVVYTTLINNANDSTISNCVDQMFVATRAKIQDVKMEHPNRPIILVGFNSGAAIACHAAILEPKNVTAVVCLGFALHTAEGNRGETDDILLDLKVPVMFVVGQVGQQTSIPHMEDMRERMTVQTHLLLVGGADDNLRLSSRIKQSEGITQSLADRCIMDEIDDFLTHILTISTPSLVRFSPVHPDSSVTKLNELDDEFDGSIPFVPSPLSPRSELADADGKMKRKKKRKNSSSSDPDFELSPKKPRIKTKIPKLKLSKIGEKWGTDIVMTDPNLMSKQVKIPSPRSRTPKPKPLSAADQLKLSNSIDVVSQAVGSILPMDEPRTFDDMFESNFNFNQENKDSQTNDVRKPKPNSIKVLEDITLPKRSLPHLNATDRNNYTIYDSNVVRRERQPIVNKHINNTSMDKYLDLESNIPLFSISGNTRKLQNERTSIAPRKKIEGIQILSSVETNLQIKNGNIQQPTPAIGSSTDAGHVLDILDMPIIFADDDNQLLSQFEQKTKSISTPTKDTKKEGTFKRELVYDDHQIIRTSESPNVASFKVYPCNSTSRTTPSAMTIPMKSTATVLSVQTIKPVTSRPTPVSSPRVFVSNSSTINSPRFITLTKKNVLSVGDSSLKTTMSNFKSIKMPTKSINILSNSSSSNVIQIYDDEHSEEVNMLTSKASPTTLNKLPAQNNITTRVIPVSYTLTPIDTKRLVSSPTTGAIKMPTPTLSKNVKVITSLTNVKKHSNTSISTSLSAQSTPQSTPPATPPPSNTLPPNDVSPKSNKSPGFKVDALTPVRFMGPPHSQKTMNVTVKSPNSGKMTTMKLVGSGAKTVMLSQFKKLTPLSMSNMKMETSNVKINATTKSDGDSGAMKVPIISNKVISSRVQQHAVVQSVEIIKHSEDVSTDPIEKQLASMNPPYSITSMNTTPANCADNDGGIGVDIEEEIQATTLKKPDFV